VIDGVARLSRPSLSRRSENQVGWLAWYSLARLAMHASPLSFRRCVSPTIVVLSLGLVVACGAKTENASSGTGGQGATTSSTASGGSGGSGGAGAGGGAGGEDACEVVSPEVIEAAWIGNCGDGTERFTDAASFAAFHAACATGAGAPPSIDFATQEVWKIDDGFIDCPFDGSPLRLGFRQCDGGLEEHLWIFSDHCFCDYFERQITVVVVEAGAQPSVTRVRHDEVGCEDSLCSCQGELVHACGEPGFSPPCQLSELENGEDGQPPSWP
jgi:hypothetical protein